MRSDIVALLTAGGRRMPGRQREVKPEPVGRSTLQKRLLGIADRNKVTQRAIAAATNRKEQTVARWRRGTAMTAADLELTADLLGIRIVLVSKGAMR